MKNRLLFLLPLYLLSSVPLPAKKVVVCDIHGVLLKEDLETLIKNKIAHIGSAHRGLADAAIFQELCNIMADMRPLGLPDESYDKALGIPYEVYALFAGLKEPEVVHEALRSMLQNAPLSAEKRTLFTTLINAIFDHNIRASALTPIPAGVALLQALQGAPEVKLLIYTNAPTAWVKQYKQLFPHIFEALHDAVIICSGTTHVLKPSREAFRIMCTEGQCEYADLILIDDNGKNCETARRLGATALHFLAPTPPAGDASSKNTTDI